MTDTEDKIEKTIVLAAPVPRVWRALTDHDEFGQWFQVKLSGPFQAGAVVTGKMTTLVEFRLDAIDSGSTRLHITDSGCSALPDPRRFDVLRENTKGWDIQADSIKRYVTT